MAATVVAIEDPAPWLNDLTIIRPPGPTFGCSLPLPILKLTPLKPEEDWSY